MSATNMYTCVEVSMYVCLLHARIHVRIYPWTFVCLHAWVFVDILVLSHSYICIYIYTYIYIHWFSTYADESMQRWHTQIVYKSYYKHEYWSRLYNIYIYIYVYTYICMYVYIYIYILTCVCVCVCAKLFFYRFRCIWMSRFWSHTQNQTYCIHEYWSRIYIYICICI